MLADARLLPAADDALEAAFEQAAEITRRNSKTFYTATGLLPPPARRAIRALYGFCRTTDDLVDREGATLAEVEAWRAAVAQPAARQTDPVLRAWAAVRERYGVDSRYQFELIDGVALDIRRQRYQTWAELERYCYLVASTVGLLSMPIIGLAPGVSLEEAAPYAIRLGVALQLTNILRDVGEDAARGRVYLPALDLARFGLTAEDILRGVSDQRFVELMKFEIKRARDQFYRALPGIALLAPAARPAVGAAALLYRAILDEIEAIGYQVQTRRAHTTSLQKLLRLPGILLTVALLQPPALLDGGRAAASA
ncbi:MAG: squalene/phytoene synthase family protein [Anaerolineales bacterium]|nr:squalene/phytoene synthase family protein [Anaerolineales bacterium]